MLDNRKEKLLDLLVREYIQTAGPVGSGVLVNKYELGVSSATVRNDLVELKNQNLIFQPHTSAGSVPTEYGFQYFVDNFLKEKEIEEEKIREIKELLENKENTRLTIKNLAKSLAKISGETILIAFEKNDIFYTGISNLPKKPEFKDHNIFINLTDIIDRLDDVIPQIYNDISEKPKILLGEKNPFGIECSTILMKQQDILIGILGLMRMDYEENLALMKYIKEFYDKTK